MCLWLLQEFGSVWRNSVVLRIDNSLGMLIGKKADDADADDAAEGDDGSDSDENMGDESKGTEGASMAVSDWGRTGYVHISRVADGRIDHLERKFKVGQAVASRILGFSSLDGIANLSLRPSIVNAAVLRYEDLTPGMLVPGKVERVGAFGVVVALSELVQGLVTPMHLADSKLRKASAMYRAGKKVKARVLTVDPANHSVLLTLMPSLVKSELPLVVSYPDGKQSTGVATVGSVVHGFVTALRPTGVIVTFYNNVHGLVPLADLTKQGIDNLKSAFYVGKPVKCRITRADAARHRLALSLATAGGASSAPTDAGDVDAFTPGMVVEGAVVSVPAGTNADDYVVVELTDGDKSARAQLPVAHLCDHLDSCSRLASGLAVGDTFPQLLVVETSRGASKVGRPALVVSAKPLLINAPKSALPATLDDVVEGTVVCGVVSHIATFGLFVRFLGGVTGLAPKANIADTFVSDAAAFFQPGQSVRGVVVGIDRERGKFEVSLKPSVLDATTGVPAEVTTAAASALYLQSLLDVEERIAAAATAGADDGSDEEGSDEEGSDDDDAGAAPESSPMDEYTPGAIVTGTVDTVKEYGVLVELPNGATGFVVTEHLDGASVEAGDSVKARVLDVDHAAGLVDLTLRGELVAAGEADAKAAKKSKKKKSKKKSKPAADTLAVGSELRARVEVVHAGRYAVVSLPSHGSAIALASITEPNRPSQPAIDGDAGVGATVAVVVTSVPADGEEGTITVSVVPPTKRRTRAGAGAGAGAGSAKPKPEKVQTPAAALEPGMIVEAVPAAKPSLGSDLSVQLKHVSGRYAARLALCEVVEFGDEPASPDTEALSKFLALKPGRKFTAKVVCAAVNAADAKKQQKRQSKAANGDADAAAATEPLVEVYLTIRAADLALPAGELATVRPSVDAEGAGVTDKSNPVSPAAVGVVPGCVAAAVVQTVNVSHLVVGLGGAVTGVVPVLAAGSLDDAGTPLAERFEVGQTTRCVCTSATGASRVRMAIAGADAALSAAVAAVRKSRSKQAKKLAATALKASLKALEGVDSAADAQRDQDVDVGAVVVGKVLRVDINVDDSKKAMRGKGKRPAQRAPVGTLTLDLGAGRKGRVCITHTADQAEWSDFPLSKFSPGQFVRGVVLSATEVSDTNKTKKGKKQSKKQSKASQFVEVSLRRSLVDQAQAEGTDAAAASAAEVLKADTAAATAVGEVVTGFVVNTMPKGCFVRLGAGITARVKVSHLADGFVKEIAVSFPPGKLVAGRVLSHDADTGLTELTLKPSRVVGAARDALFASLERGQAFPAKVTRVETYGVFAELQVPKEEGSGMRGSGLTGLCHVKEVADEYVADLTKAYTIGDDVRVIVLEVDTEKKRVSLGMKPSYFENEDSDDEAMDGVKVLQPVDADSSDDELVQGGDANGSSDDDNASGSGSDEESGSDSDDDAAGNGPTSTLDVSGLAAEVAASDDSGSDEEDVVGASTNGLSVGFNWASGEAADEDEDMGSDGDASDSGSDSDSDDDANAGAGKSKRNKQAAARREEEAVRAKELELLSADVVPEAEADFERLIVADPNNSFLWIKFMAFQLSRTEVEKARVIARRALKTISFRDEQEKLNIWYVLARGGWDLAGGDSLHRGVVCRVALLNLEHQYGDKDTLAAVFSEAQQHNDPKQVFLQMVRAHGVGLLSQCGTSPTLAGTQINIYERAHADEDADALHAIAARKFGSSKTVRGLPVRGDTQTPSTSSSCVCRCRRSGSTGPATGLSLATRPVHASSWRAP